MRDVIIAEIKRVAAANGGKPPGVQLFRSQTGIAESKWRGIYWARWGDALTEAGYSANAWQEKLDSKELLRKVAVLTRTGGRLPTYAELQLMRRADPSVPSPKTMREHFSGRGGLLEALRAFCRDDLEFQGVLSILPEPVSRRERATSVPAEGWVYLLKSGQYYKIGRSDQLEARLKRIAVALPDAAVLVHSIRTDDPPGIEAYWHRRFADRRMNGEWFKLSAADVSAFTRRSFQ